jgi:hypothetical protein
MDQRKSILIFTNYFKDCCVHVILGFCGHGWQFEEHDHEKSTSCFKSIGHGTCVKWTWTRRSELMK